MFVELIGLVKTLLELLAKIKINKSDKKAIGRSLTKLYTGLIEVNENGEEILQYLGRFKKARSDSFVDKTLLDLLSAQEARIKSIRKVIENSRTAAILKIHLPQLTDMQVLLQVKANTIAVLTEQLKGQDMRRFRPVRVDTLLTFHFMLSDEPKPLRLVPPTKTQLKKSHSDLDELKRLSDLLRQFVVENFEIDEII